MVWRWAVAALILQLLWIVSLDKAKEAVSAEMKAKVVFIGKMLQFVEWPEDRVGKGGEKGEGGETRAGGSSALQFCVAGDRYLSFAFAKELHGTKLQGRMIEVRSVLTERDLRGCAAVYFAGTFKGPGANWLTKLQGTKVLTLGEGNGFLDAGGMVEITCKNDIVQFEVNLDGVRSAGLKIDARFLEMAKGVTRTRKTASD